MLQELELVKGERDEAIAQLDDFSGCRTVLETHLADIEKQLNTHKKESDFKIATLSEGLEIAGQ